MNDSRKERVAFWKGGRAVEGGKGRCRVIFESLGSDGVKSGGRGVKAFIGEVLGVIGRHGS